MLFGTRRRAGASSGRPVRRYGIPGRPGLVPGTIGRAGTAYEDSAAGASDGKNRQTRRSSLPAIARPQAGGAISARYPPEQPGHFPVGARRSLRQSPSCPHASSGRPARTDFPNTHAECPPRNPAAPAAPRAARRHGIPSVAPGGQTSPQADGFIVIAILAAVAALAAIIFGLTVTHGGPDILPLIESSSPDTTQVQPIAE